MHTVIDDLVSAFFFLLLLILIPSIWSARRDLEMEREREKKRQGAAGRVKDSIIAGGRGLPGDVEPKQ